VLFLPEGCELAAGVVGNHGLLTGLPRGGADFTMLVRELESLDETESLFDVAADGEVADRDVADDLVGVDDVGGAEGDAGILTILDECTVGLGNGLVQIGEHGDVHFAEATLVSGLLGVFLMDEGRVDGASNDLAVDLLKLSRGVGELADFGGADEGEIEGPEEQDNVFT